MREGGEAATRTVVLVAAMALALLAVAFGLAVRDVEAQQPPLVTTTSSSWVRRHHRPTTTTINPLNQPAGVARDILDDAGGAVCTALSC